MTNNTEQQAVPVAQELDETTPGFLIDLASRIHAKATPAMGFDGYDVDRLIEIAKSLAEPASLPCKSGEGAGEPAIYLRDVFANAVQHALQYEAADALYQWQEGGGGAKFLFQATQIIVDAIIPIIPDATQTREAELVESIEPTTLAQCPPGLFWSNNTLGFKSQYHNDDGSIYAFIVSNGEFFWGPSPQTIARQREILVRPVDIDYAEEALNARGGA